MPRKASHENESRKWDHSSEGLLDQLSRTGQERLKAARILSALPLCLSLVITGSSYFSKKILEQNKEKVTPSSNDRLQVDTGLLYGITRAKRVVIPLLQDTTLSHVSADRFVHHLYAFSTG